MSEHKSHDGKHHGFAHPASIKSLLLVFLRTHHPDLVDRISVNFETWEVSS